MKRVSAALALTALAATTLALAQTPAPTEPPSSEQQQTSPTTQPSAPASTTQQSDPSTSSENGNADTRAAMMQDCVKQVQAANPSVPQQDIKDYCDKQLKAQSSPRD
jgi:hypothetical protein